MKIKLLKWIGFWGIFLGIGLLALQVQAQGSMSQVEESDTCVQLRQERLQLCDEAARQCIEVYKYDAFNKITPCAHYSQRCSEMGRQEAENCYAPANSRISLKGGNSNRVANPGKTL